MKAAMLFQLTVKVGKCRMLYNTKNWQNVKKLEFLQIVGKGKNWCSHFRNNLAEFSDTKHKTNL